VSGFLFVGVVVGRYVFGRGQWEELGGGVAQLGERLNGIQEVRGSIPLASTVQNGRACFVGLVG
jgi:hypothetical protein